MSNKIIITGIIDVAAFLIVSLLVFTHISTDTDAFISSYVFLGIAILVQIVPVFLTDKKRNIAYNMAFYTVSFLYLLLQFVVSILGFTLISSRGNRILAYSMVLVLIYGGITLTIYVLTTKK